MNGLAKARLHDQDDCHAHNMAEPFKNLLQNQINTMILKLGMQHLGQKLCKDYINDDPALTWTYFTERSNLVKIAYCANTGPDVR